MKFLPMLLLFGFLSSPAAAQDVTVYVGVPTREGFVDPGANEREESAADLREALTGRPGLRLVETAADADVRVIVTDRRYRPVRGNKLEATLEAGSYRVELGSSYSMKPGRPWKGPANNLAGKVEDWIRKNRDRLTAQRTR